MLCNLPLYISNLKYGGEKNILSKYFFLYFLINFLLFFKIKNVDIKYPFEMSNGDMVHMFDDCQDKYQHSVRRVKTKIGPRISLVFKKSIKK